jgi:hypothetical protein
MSSRLTGLALLSGSATARDLLSWLWPPALLVLAAQLPRIAGR